MFCSLPCKSLTNILLNLYLNLYLSIVLIFFKDFYLFVFRERGRQAGGRNINVQEKNQWAASHISPAEDLTHNPGMCPNWELNQ